MNESELKQRIMDRVKAGEGNVVEQPDPWRVYKKCPDDEEIAAYSEGTLPHTPNSPKTHLIQMISRAVVLGIVLVAYIALVLLIGIGKDSRIALILLATGGVLLGLWVSEKWFNCRKLAVWWHIRRCTFCRSEVVQLKQILLEEAHDRS